MNASPPVRATVRRKFTAPAEDVFDAWLDPRLLGRWMFGPAVRAERVVQLTVDPRVGGRFSFRLDRQGAAVEYTGEYLELERDRLLVFTWGRREQAAPAGRVIVEIIPDFRGCELTLHHVLAPDEAIHVAAAADLWGTMLDLLDGILS